MKTLKEMFESFKETFLLDVDPWAAKRAEQAFYTAAIEILLKACDEKTLHTELGKLLVEGITYATHEQNRTLADIVGGQRIAKTEYEAQTQDWKDSCRIVDIADDGDTYIIKERTEL